MTDTAPLPDSPAPLTPSTCPVCGLSDAVQRVSTVIDGGTSSTSGTAFTFATRDHRTHLDPTIYSSQTVSQLAARLAPPAPPAFHLVRWFLILWLGGAVVVGVIAGGFAGSGGAASYIIAGVLGLWLPAFIAAVIVRRVQAGKYQVLTSAWRRKSDALRSGYYCARDDVVFDGTKVERPESFRASIFG
jgi:hypothetical protein